jgi:hypothetical protein
MGTGGPLPGGKAWPGRDANHSPHPVPRSRMSRSYNSLPPWRLHGVAGQLYFIILLRKHNEWVWSGISWLRIESSEGVLRTGNVRKLSISLHMRSSTCIVLPGLLRRLFPVLEAPCNLFQRILCVYYKRIQTVRLGHCL